MRETLYQKELLKYKKYTSKNICTKDIYPMLVCMCKNCHITFDEVISRVKTK